LATGGIFLSLQRCWGDGIFREPNDADTSSLHLVRPRLMRGKQGEMAESSVPDQFRHAAFRLIGVGGD
jgi:hypothetical protein